MKDSNYTKVFTGNFIIVQRLVSELEAENINAIIKDESESGRLAGFGSSIQGQQDLFVNKEEAVAALKIIEGVTAELDA
ncbi:putative signal transducing protein [Formosa algae]|uniref:DUF2007 domain-containing protein n=1 Tax=Formosa algae TaxID=225843 RepID=A0A9X0YIR1_9FLAO|nr:DUF2007 domain-containing protein [Formosa algae]MBP1839805.1 hypothetical protein [Formosa algae]MDQ0335404.1 hypothetical protein [Formosa algae]OEI79205.1 hypothetical protein AST99_15385 [Formosa algae]PNW28021.1 hypothetical protein BKP44_10200 [Formosa algae]